MVRLLACLLFLLPAMVVLAGDQLPNEPEPSFEVEPPLLIPELPKQRESQEEEESAPEPETNPEQIAAALEKAKRRAAAAERLFRGGVIAKVEAENRALQVVRLEADLANAQLQQATANVAAQQAGLEAGKIKPEEVERSKAELAQDMAAAQEASAKRDQAEMEAAVRNLQRQKKLLALGSARRADVNRAEEKVAALQQRKN